MEETVKEYLCKKLTEVMGAVRPVAGPGLVQSQRREFDE